MTKINYSFILLFFYFLIVGLLSSCSKPGAGDSEIIDDNEGGGNTGNTFKQEIRMTVVENGVESDILIDELIGAFITVDEISGYSIKRIEIVTGWEDTYPQMDMDIPFRVDHYEFGTSYGEERDFFDYFGINLSEEEYFSDNTPYADIIEGDWIQPWIEVTSITELGDGEYGLEAIFGGTLISYDYGSGSTTAKAITIKSGTIKVSAPDSSPNIPDNSAGFANPPVVGGGTGGGGGGPNNIIADFDIRYPGTYISGTQMLFDTATLTIENKSSNAQYFEWELVHPSTNLNQSYFYVETQIGQTFFSRNVKLNNAADTSKYYVQLTAYDEHGNSKTVRKSASLPMIKGEFYLDGELVNRGNIWYHAQGDRYRMSVGGVGWDNFQNSFNFGIKGMYPPMGTYLENFYQMSNEYLPFPDTDYEFYAEIDGESTFDDPDGQYSWLVIDNYSIQVVRGEMYGIFGKVNASFTVEDPMGEQHSIEIRYLAPLDMY